MVNESNGKKSQPSSVRCGRLSLIASLTLLACTGPQKEKASAANAASPREVVARSTATSALPPEPISQELSPDAILGRWVGVGYQDDGSNWGMDVTLYGAEEGLCGQVSYPSLHCAATWTCQDGYAGGELQAVETLTEGWDHCADQGVMSMHLTPDGKQLRWTWYGDAETGTARAILVRPHGEARDGTKEP